MVGFNFELLQLQVVTLRQDTEETDHGFRVIIKFNADISSVHHYQPKTCENWLSARLGKF